MLQQEIESSWFIGLHLILLHKKVTDFRGVDESTGVDEILTGLKDKEEAMGIWQEEDDFGSNRSLTRGIHLV